MSCSSVHPQGHQEPSEKLPGVQTSDDHFVLDAHTANVAPAVSAPYRQWGHRRVRPKNKGNLDGNGLAHRDTAESVRTEKDRVTLTLQGLSVEG